MECMGGMLGSNLVGMAREHKQLRPCSRVQSLQLRVQSLYQGGTCKSCIREVDVRLPEKGNSKSHGTRPVTLIITMLKWILTRRLSRKKSLSLGSRKEQG